MIRPLGFVATLVLAVCLLGVGIAGSETAKSAKKTEAMTQVPTPTPMLAGKPGGTLNVMLREDLSQGFAVHESATISVVFPSSPCFNNLVMFDPANPVENPDSVVPELAERWSWQDNYRNLVMFLRKNVKWHDGQPFTSKDVKYTFDMVREAPESHAKLRLNPRKDWYANVEAIEAADPYTVVFRLKRPQPSLLMLLASGYSPIYAAHINPADYRTRCIGTGPFSSRNGAGASSSSTCGTRTISSRTGPISTGSST